MSENRARFQFRSKSLEVEFEGDEEFVEGQIGHLRASVESEARKVAGGGPGGRTSPQPSGDQSPSLEEFYRRAKSREGRGALQETILIFAYFLPSYFN